MRQSREVPETMGAIVLTGPGEFELQEIAVPSPRGDEVLCRVHACAICGTDPKIVSGAFAGTWPAAYPAVIGHEWCGEVVEPGPEVRESTHLAQRFAPGVRVAGEAHKGCGTCGNCLRGRYTLCENYGDHASGHRHYGFTAPGAYTEYICVSAKSLHLLPDELTYEQGSMVDTAGVALQGVRRGRVEIGDKVVVLGPGPIGLFTMQYARAAGAEQTFVVGRKERLRVAEGLGAITIDYEAGDPAEQVQEITAGNGADVVIECAGSATACRWAIGMTRKGGRLVMNGIPTEPVEIPWSKIVLDEIDMLGVRANPNTSEAALALIANGSVAVGPILTHTFPLSEFGEALATFTERRDGALKVVVTP